MISCPFCGEGVPSIAAFCMFCGKALPKPEKKTCPGCGQELPAESAFCLFCGTKLPESAVEPELESAVEPESETVVEPEPEAVVEPEPEAVVEPEPEAIVEPEPETVIEPEPETAAAPDPSADLKCPSCGAALEPDSAFCPYCGTSVPAAAEADAEEQPTPVDEARLSAARARIAPAAGLISACDDVALAACVSGEVRRLDKAGALKRLDGRRWKVRSLAAGRKHNALVLADGGMLLVPLGYPMEDLGWHAQPADAWRFVAAACTDSNVYALSRDGTLNKFLQTGYDCSGLRELRAVAADGELLVWLLRNGTVSASDPAYQGPLSAWNEIAAVAVGGGNVFGVRSDGTVLAAGPASGDGSPVTDAGVGSCGERDVSGWTDIVAVAASRWHTVGLRADGTVCAAGGLKCEETQVSGWTDVVAVAAGAGFTLGLRSDGTVLFAGENGAYRKAVQSWRLFDSLDTLEVEREAQQADISDLFSFLPGLSKHIMGTKGQYGGYPEYGSEPAARSCPHCGQPIKADAAFCAYCGKSASAPAAPAKEPPKEPPAEPPRAERSCPHCGQPIEADAAFCPFCGKSTSAPAAPAEEPPKEPPAEPPRSTRSCPHCGQQMDANAAFCAYCGKSASAPAAPPAEPPATPREKKGGFFSAIGGAIQNARDTKALHDERKQKARSEIKYRMSTSPQLQGIVAHLRQNCRWAYETQGPSNVDDTDRRVEIKPEGVYICRKAYEMRRVRDGDRMVDRREYVVVDEVGLSFERSGFQKLGAYTSDVVLDDRTGKKVVISANEMCGIFGTVLQEAMAREFPECRFKTGWAGTYFSYNTPKWELSRGF